MLKNKFIDQIVNNVRLTWKLHMYVENKKKHEIELLDLQAILSC